MPVRMLIKGLMMDPVTNMPIVVLRDEPGERTLPIWIGMFEAHAVALQLENSGAVRPMTHDLLRQAIEALGGTVREVHITDVREGTFFAVIYLDAGGEVVALDARPSDALALALRSRAPVFVDESVLADAKPVDAPTTQDAERLQHWLESLDPEEMGKYKM
ncbi:MAG: bifunctional nuclease family protein [Luteitalea sp.]|nr:bifunctional nuclease family protein [Acidobacteriota bacterium]